MMKHDELYLWTSIADAVGKQCPSIYCYIMENIENEDVLGFSFHGLNSIISVQAIGNEVEPIASSTYYPLEFQDPKGTFEGLPIDLQE